MASVIYVLSIVVMIAVAVVLIRGLINMLKGGDGNVSNKLMRMRVMLQFLAVVLIVVFLVMTGGGR